MNFHDLIEQNFGNIPTSQQREVFLLLQKFVLSSNVDSCFVLKGYAGTGKTTLSSALVKVLPQVKLKSVLLAPTGRAAKVISNYSGRKAFTIHKKIYRKKEAASPDMNFVLGDNLMENTLFIVDEASMIPDEMTESKLWENGSLLDDLMTFIDISMTNKHFIIFIFRICCVPIRIKRRVQPSRITHFFQIIFSVS